MPLAEDRIRALERRPELPEGNPTQVGFPVAYAGTDEDGDDIFAMTSFPDTEIQQGHGDPNTNVNAPKGTLYVDLDGPGLWQNTDGVDTWTQVGGSSGFPISYDDGTTTYEIDVSSGKLRTRTIHDSGTVTRAEVDLYNDGNYEVDTFNTGAMTFNCSAPVSAGVGGGFFVNDANNPGGGIFLNSYYYGISMSGPNSSGITLQGTAAGYADDVILLGSKRVIHRGQTAAPNTTDWSNGDFAFYFNTSTKVLSVKGRSSGTIYSLDIGTLT